MWRGSSGGAFTGALSPVFLLFRREALGSCASSGGFRLLGGLGILLGLVPGSSFSRWGGVGVRGASRYRARADAACGLGVRTSGGGSSCRRTSFSYCSLSWRRLSEKSLKFCSFHFLAWGHKTTSGLPLFFADSSSSHFQMPCLSQNKARCHCLSRFNSMLIQHIGTKTPPGPRPGPRAPPPRAAGPGKIIHRPRCCL